MNRYESYCEELFPDLYKIAHLITGDSSAASDLAVSAVVQGIHRQRSMKTLADARIELMRILYAECMDNSFDTPGYGKLAALDYSDRCLVVFRYCSGLKFPDFCRTTGYATDQAHSRLSRIASALQLSKSTDRQLHSCTK